MAGLIVLCLAAPACGAGPPPTAGSTTTTIVPEATTTTSATLDPGEELARARQLWADAELSTYRYLFVDDCGECFQQGPLPMIVWEGIPSRQNAVTVERMFEAIATALDQRAPVEVTYDPDLGYPTDLWIDREARAYDGGTHWLIQQLDLGLPADASAPEALAQARSSWERQRPASYETETQIICDCSFDGTVRTVVEGTEIVDWEVTFTDGVGGDISPITIDDMFGDLADIVASPDGFEEDGARFRAFAQYDQELGYPSWVALDIEILDPNSSSADLPSRLVTSVTRLEPVGTAQDPEPTAVLEAARGKWRAAGLTNYSYELTIHDIQTATFTDPYLVVVGDGEVTSVSQGGNPVLEWDPAMLPVDGLFDMIGAHLAANDIVETLYEDGWGYPVLITIRGSDSDFVLVISLSNLEPGAV
ncbi:MAG: DUF6174 domain-containing protein [Acidimicrobiia bacterium]